MELSKTLDIVTAVIHSNFIRLVMSCKTVSTICATINWHPRRGQFTNYIMCEGWKGVVDLLFFVIMEDRDS